MNDLLAICLPTFQSASCLKGFLHNVVPQAKAFDIPIYVFVSHSTDDTLQVLKDCQKEYPLLFFKYNDGNFGFNKNLLKAIEMSKSKYVWAMGVRRRLVASAVKTVLDALRLNPDLVVMSKVARKSVQKDLFYDDLQEVFARFYDDVALLGGSILPLKAWKLAVLGKYLEDARLGEWGHFAMVFEYLSSLSNFKAMFINSPLLSSATYSPTSNAQIFKYMNSWANVVWELPRIKAEAKVRAIEEKYKLLCRPQTLISMRRTNNFDHDTFKAYHNVFSNSTIPLVISRFPIAILTFLFTVYLAVKGLMRSFIHSPYPINPLNDD